MALFKPYQRPGEKPAKASGSTAAPKPATTTEATSTFDAALSEMQSTAPKKIPVKKNAPTPTRKQAERERMERLHPTLSPKERKRADRQLDAQKRNEVWEKREAAPEKVLMRNFIDSKWHLTEFLLPLMIIPISTIFLYRVAPVVMELSVVFVWGVLLLCLIDITVTWFRFRKLLAERLPHASRRGLLLSMVNRMIQFRRFRLPKPVVERGAKI